MNQNIINFIIKIKNASMINKESICVSINNLSYKIIKLLYKEGFIQSVKRNNNNFIIYLRYSFNKNLFKNLKIFSSSSLNYYISYNDICKITQKKIVLLLSTNQGFLTGLECKKNKIGGKLFIVL